MEEKKSVRIYCYIFILLLWVLSWWWCPCCNVIIHSSPSQTLCDSFSLSQKILINSLTISLTERKDTHHAQGKV